MTSRVLTCLTLSDFNLATFHGFLANDATLPAVRIAETAFGAVHDALLDPKAACWEEAPDVVVVWTRPEAVIHSYSAILQGEPASTDEILAEVDRFADLVLGLESRVAATFMPTWITMPGRQMLATLDMKGETGTDAALFRMNARLVERFSDSEFAHLLNASRWISTTNPASWKLWYMAKNPYSDDVFRRAAATLKGALRGIAGGSRKLVLLDLDNTLWGGVVGETGWEGLRLGGHDPIGEAFVDFQRLLKALTRRGIALGIVSRNDESVALEAIERHPEMVLQIDDFAGWRINWEDKARNAVALVDELNLGLDAAVFIDDSRMERARVSEALPDILVPDWPRDPMLYRKSLEELTCFDSPGLSTEDRGRAGMYAAERRRRSSRQQVVSVDEWLSSLQIEVVVEPLSKTNLARATQLLNKTNQMNLATRRLTEVELEAWAGREDRCVLTFQVSDRFGDLGLVGLVSLETHGEGAEIVDFLMSCRAMGRNVEESMLSFATRHAESLGSAEIRATFRPTKRNGPLLAFLVNCPFERGTATETFSWDLARQYPAPEHVALRDDAFTGRLQSVRSS